MKDQAAGDEEFTAPVLDGPLYDERALLVKVDHARTASDAVRSFAEGSVESEPLGEVLKYVEQFEGAGAELTPVYEERATHRWSDGGWRLAANADAAPIPGIDLSGLHHLRLAKTRDLLRLKARLERDLRLTVSQPPILYPLDAPRDLPFVPPQEPQWWLSRCGFPRIWADLERNPSPGRIAIVDQGRNTMHREFKERLSMRTVRRTRAPSRSIHACAVAGVITAARDGTGVSGCCDAEVVLYSIWASDDDFDSLACIEALKDLAQPRQDEPPVRVVNISLGTRVDNPCIRRQIQEIIQAGVIVVAAMGNHGEKGNEPIYPAAYPGVIAVGATTEADTRASWSAMGSHVRIAAPGESILTTYGGDSVHEMHGTSFAAPQVAAAIWLALRARPCWGLHEIEEMLRHSTAVPAPHDSQVGFGRLDMTRLRDFVHSRRKCPP
jgi:hypothetical protein